MSVPTAGCHLYEAHAALHQTTGHEQLGSHRVPATATHPHPAGHCARVGIQLVKVPHCLGFLAHIEGICRLGLHLESDFERLNTGLKLSIFLELSRMHFVHLRCQIDLPALTVQAAELAADIGQNGRQARVRVIIDVTTLVYAWQEGALAESRITAKGNETGHVLIDASEAVNHP